MSGTEAFFEAKDAILAAVPEDCQTCVKPRREARNAAQKVVDGEITLDDAKQSVSEDIGRNCLLGLGVVGGCAGNSTVCGYGGRELTDTEQTEAAFRLGVLPEMADPTTLLIDVATHRATHSPAEG